MRPWIELARISNTPTVAANVLAGVAIGMLERLSGAAPHTGTTALLLGGAVLSYSAGMMLNDAFDARIDLVERPCRPVPSGRAPRGLVFIVGLLALGAGTALLSLAGEGLFPWALLLAASVLLYDALHQQLPGAWLLPGLCRALVVLIAARATSPAASWELIAWVGGSVWLYVSLVSLAARDEMRTLRGVGQLAAVCVPVAALAPAGLLLFDVARTHAWVVFAGLATLGALALPVAAWGAAHAGRGKAGTRGAVGAWLGTIALMDAAVCFLADRPFLALACLGLWGVAGALRPRVAAT